MYGVPVVIFYLVCEKVDKKVYYKYDFIVSSNGYRIFSTMTDEIQDIFLPINRFSK